MRFATVSRALVAAMAALALIALTTTSAFAGDKLTSVLDELEWGMTSKEVMAKLEARIWVDFEAETQNITDIGKKDKVRKQYKNRADRLKESYRELKSSARSGLEVSVVSDEFIPDNNEAVVVVRDDVATRYYFFVNDQLYKCAVAYDPKTIGDLAFESFIDMVARKYGKPGKQINDEEGFYAQALWESGGSRLRVEDKWDTYDTYLMSFTDTAIEATVSAKHKAAIQARYTEPEIGADINALTEGQDEMGRSAADALLGGDTKVDLKAGLPQEDIDAMAEAELAADASTGDKSGVSKKKKKKKKKDTRKKKNFKDLEKKEENKGLIIY